MADLNYLDPKSPLQKIAEKLDGEPTTQVDPDSLMSRIATAVEDGAGGGGGYSVETIEYVLFDGNVLVHYDSDEDGWFIGGKDMPVLSKPLVEGTNEIVVSFDEFTETYSLDAFSSDSELNYVSSDDNKLLYIYLRDDAQYFAWKGYNLDVEKADFNVHLKLYTSTESVEVSKDFTKAVDSVTGYSINKSDEILLNITDVHLA